MTSIVDDLSMTTQEHVPPPSHGRASLVRRVVHGPDTDPAWARPSLLSLLAGTAVLYLWGLGASGWANSFYSAAVQAGTHSWKAFFYGSLDSGNAITVDKPPASLWAMELSARVFGVNSWSILVPQALMGVAAVGLLYATVRRQFGPAAGLLASTALALTPVATLMFRFNNPDALLVLLLVGAGYAFIRAVEATSTRWLLVAAVLVGTGFITKMLQAFLVVPVFAVVYLVVAATPLRRRLVQLVAAGAALVVASGWWVAIVELTPASARPYIGGSQSNSVLNLIFGYNGFGRITGNETGSVGGGPAGTAGRWGSTGLLRMFGTDFGGQISWLIPAALLLFVALLWVQRHAPRTDVRRAQVLMWGGWLVVTALTFSYAQGIIHAYYSVALAPAIGALVGTGAVVLWTARRSVVARVFLVAAIAVTAWWSWVLLTRTPAWHPALRTAVVVAGVVAGASLLVVHYLDRWVAAVVAMVALATALAGPVAYSLSAAATPHTGAIPAAGPAALVGRGMPGPMAGGARGGMTPPAGGFTPPAGGFTPPTGGFAPPGGGMNTPAGGTTRGGLLDARTPSSEVVAALTDHAGDYRWVAATVGANNAAGYQLAADLPVMSIGGFNGTDPSPTLAQFQALVAADKIHYFIPGGGMFGGGGSSGSGTAAQITAWVEQNYQASTIGTTTMYDLSK